MVEVIVKYNGELDVLARELGAGVEVLGDAYAILTLPQENIQKLYNYREIEYIELPKNLSLLQSEHLHAPCITPVHSGVYDLRGEGVLVAIIDSGIDYRHEEFLDGDGKSRILYFWDQLGVGEPPDGFSHGAEYSAEQLTDGAKLLGDYVGHGTAVAGIAAGRSGAAPEAGIIAVKLGEKGRQFFARTTEIMRALKYVTDKAAELNMPLVINLSFGTNDGSHSGSSLFETYIDAVSRRWKTVIVAAMGNEGAGKHHYAGKIEKGETDEVIFSAGGGFSSMYLLFWSNFADTFELELVASDGNSSGKIRPRDGSRQIVLSGIDVTITYDPPSFYNQNQEVHILMSKKEGKIPESLWKLLVTGREVTDGTFHIWLPTVEEVGAATAFLKPDPHNTLTLPATAEYVISVGGYNSKIGSAADFSGQGFTVGSVYVKPDIVAPAVGISSAKMGGGMDAFSGTSMAAPFVTGATALMMQWGIVRGNDPFLYGQRVKAYLQKTAKRAKGIEYPNATWGYGSLCLQAAMDALIESSF